MKFFRKHSGNIVIATFNIAIAFGLILFGTNYSYSIPTVWKFFLIVIILFNVVSAVLNINASKED